MTFQIILLQAAIEIPIWLAIIGIFGTILTSAAGAYFVSYLARPKTKVEIEEKKLGNREKQLKNFDYANDIFTEAQALIETYQKKDLEQIEKIHTLESTLSIKKMDFNKLQGKLELALDERESAVIEAKRLETKYAKVEAHAQEVDAKILLLEKDNEDLKRNNEALNDRLNILVGLMQKEGMAIPEEFQWTSINISNDSNHL